jgi:hypothetical protein
MSRGGISTTPATRSIYAWDLDFRINNIIAWFV